MAKVVGAVTMSLALVSASGAYSQEIGIVTATPNAVTGELVVDLPPRPDGEKLYIVRDGQTIAEGTVKPGSRQGGTVIALPMEKVNAVNAGDRVSLSPTLEKQLPASAYEVKAQGDVLPPHPGQAQLAAQARGVSVEVSAPEAGAPAGAVGASVTESVSTVQTAIARPTPRGMGVPLYPAPATASVEGGIAAPYGQGLAAAAPIGTPYLRSPAFAGPPIIYMPQTVTRVLLPGATPYPSNIMSPPSNYIYASAPFIRTDIYTSLPYGTFYWPQGYAGTTPVEPQVPAYVTAPASAIVSAEAGYTSARYAPGVASAETLNPVASGVNENLVGTAGASISADPSFSLPTLSTEAASPFTPMAAPEPAVQPFPVLSDTNSAAPVAATPAPAPGLPTLPSSEPTGLPTLPSSAPSAPSGLPTLPSAPDQSALPTLPSASPASMLPSLPTSNQAPSSVSIIVDDSAPGALTLTPTEAWTPSANTAESHGGSSLMATVVPGQTKSATFNAAVPADGQYELALNWTSGAAQFRANNVPVTVHTATGPQQVTIDQTQPGNWHSLGVFALKSGDVGPVVTISTDGITPQGDAVSVSVDALRIVSQ